MTSENEWPCPTDLKIGDTIQFPDWFYAGSIWTVVAEGTFDGYRYVTVWSECTNLWTRCYMKEPHDPKYRWRRVVETGRRYGCRCASCQEEFPDAEAKAGETFKCWSCRQ